MKNRNSKIAPDFDMIQKSLVTEWQTRPDKKVPDDSPQQDEDKKDN